MKKTLIKWINISSIIVILLLMSIIDVQAAEGKNPGNNTNLSSYDEREGLAQVHLVYIDSNNQTHILKQGCGFFIGDEETGEYILTNYSTITLTEEEKNAYLTQFAIESGRLDTTIQIILQKDVVLDFSYENGSQTMDLAVLSPKTSLGNVTTLRLAEEEHFSNGIAIHTLGYMDLAGGNTEITSKEGNLEDWITRNDIHYLKHNVVIDGNNKGGPLMNENGEVIGVNVAYTDGSYYSLQINEVIELLNTLGIIYNPQIVVETTGLEETIQIYEEQNFSKYTEESVSVCEEQYMQAKELLLEVEQGNTNPYTQDRIETINKQLIESMDNLQKKGMTKKQLVILFIVITALLFIAIVVLIVLLILKKKKLTEALEREKHLKPAERMNMEERILPDTTSSRLKNYLPENRTLAEIAAQKPEAPAFSETTVLNTTVMDNPIQEKNVLKICPVLTRLKTGERIQINKNSFLIGKASEQVDYYISGNPGISRIHICIKCMRDGYYVQDLKTTNGTYVDGIKVSWDRDIKLSDGCMIKMADEEFEFRLNA